MIRLSLTMAAMLYGSAFGWIAPVDLTATAGYEVGVRADADSNNHVHIVWYGADGDASTWKIHHQVYNGVSWSAPLAVSGTYAAYPDIAVDGSNNLHVVWNAGANPEEIYYRKRTAGVWGSIANLSNTPSNRSLSPRVAVDATGNHIFVVWHENGMTGGNWDIVGRRWNGGSWEATENVSNDGSLSRNANIAIDAAGAFHIVWEDTDTKRAYYRKRNPGGGYTAAMALDPDATYRSYGPDIAISANGHIHTVWHEDLPGSEWDFVYRTWNGTSWGPMVNLSNQPGVIDCCGTVDTDSSNQVYAVWHDYNGIYFARTIGTVWQPWYKLAAGPNHTGPFVLLTPDNTSHVLYQARFDTPPATGWDVMWTWRTNPDTTPPAPVTGLTAVGKNTAVQLSWVAPTNLDYVSTMVRYKLGGYPVGPTDGTLGCVEPGPRGAADGCTVTGLTNGLTYYFAAFAQDDAGNRSSAALAAAVPAGPADFDRDGDVDLSDFAHFQACLSGTAVPQADPACAGARLDADADVDGDDLVIFRGCLSGADIYANPHCAG